MTGDNKDLFNEMSINILIARYNLVLNETELNKLNNWLNDSSRAKSKFLKDVYSQ